MEKEASRGLNEVLLENKIFELTKLVRPSDTRREPAKKPPICAFEKKNLMWLMLCNVQTMPTDGEIYPVN